jgi:hypothetical protein
VIAGLDLLVLTCVPRVLGAAFGFSTGITGAAREREYEDEKFGKKMCVNHDGSSAIGAIRLCPSHARFHASPFTALIWPRTAGTARGVGIVSLYATMIAAYKACLTVTT